MTQEQQRQAQRAVATDPVVARRVALARLALMWERLWPALWPPLGVIGCFVALSLFGLWSILPGWLHVLGLVGFAGALGWALWRARGAVALPDRADGVHRLERTGGVPHRPLTSAEDALASGASDSATVGTWELHLQRMREAARRLRVRWPHPDLAARDPLALRAVVVLLCAVGLLAAGDRAGSRLAQAFDPSFGGAAAGPVRGMLTAWLTPPDYTGLPPLFLTGAAESGLQTVAATTPSDAPIAAPANSRLVARVHGGAQPDLIVDGEITPFTIAAEGEYEIEQAMPRGSRVEVVQAGVHLGDWNLTLVPDQAPVVALVGAPEQTGRGVLRLEYEASDDYGLETMVARFARLDTEAADALVIDLPLPGRAPTEVQEASYHDLTPHPWAGLPVQLQVRATDQIGQVGAAEPVNLVMPFREFNHPIARAIVEQRRTLALDVDTYPAVRLGIGAIAERTDEYGEDYAAYLMLKTVASRLETAPDDGETEELLKLLWEVALRIEAGALPMAESRLRDAQEALRDALDEGASNEEIERLMEELKDALNDYLDEMEHQETARDTGNNNDRQDNRPTDQQRTRADLQQMLEQAGEMATTGSREQARQMLSEVQEMLENMEPGSAGADNAPSEGEQMMERLQELSLQQEELLNETFDQSPTRGENERMAPGRGDTGADEQEALRRALGDLMRQLGESGEEIPEALGRAERQMRDAREDLERGRPDRAVDSQARALEMMREGAVQLQAQWAQRQGTNPGESDRDTSQNQQRDPLGRLPPGKNGDPSGFVDIPEESDIQRSREILDELYRRAGQRARPEEERRYIDRLLRWY